MQEKGVCVRLFGFDRVRIDRPTDDLRDFKRPGQHAKGHVNESQEEHCQTEDPGLGLNQNEYVLDNSSHVVNRNESMEEKES